MTNKYLALSLYKQKYYFMGRELTEYEKEVYGVSDVVETPEPEPIVEAPVVEETPLPEAVIEAPVAEVTTEPVVETPAPYKSKKFIEVEDEKALYEKLNAKYRHEHMKPDEKALAYIKQQNPELDDNDILFMAEAEYGIGVVIDDVDEMDDEQKLSLRKQEIARKKLFKQADNYFEEQASQVALPDYDPLDLDPDYRDYRTNVNVQAQKQQEQQDKLDNILTQLETNSKTISEITESVEIELDEGKLAIPVKFKLNEEKQKQLADFAKRYTPTTEEYNAFNDPETGKFDYKGYMESLAPMAFAKDIAKAGMRQALAQDRQQFIEKELKNSTLRNNDVSQIVEKPFDIVEAWQFGN